jgi:hypothetical protein
MVNGCICSTIRWHRPLYNCLGRCSFFKVTHPSVFSNIFCECAKLELELLELVWETETYINESGY